MGSIFGSGTAAVKPPKGAVIIAITAITATTFTTLDDERSGTVQCVGISDSPSHNLGASAATSDEGEGGVSMASQAIPIGTTIYGRWTAATATASNQYIAYIGR